MSERVEPVDTLAEALDATMPALIDLDPDWQSRWSTASLLVEELRERGYTLAASPAALDVERLARAMRACAGPKTQAAITWEGWIASAEPVAAEYARLTEQEEERHG